MAERVGCGSLTGRWEPRLGGPNLRGGLKIERDIPPDARLWLTGWTRKIAGGQVVLVVVEIAEENGKPV